MSGITKKEYDYLLLTENQDILTITLNRAAKKNALSFVLMRELIDIAQRLKKDKTVRVVIINGSGDAFCTGIDLNELSNPKNRFLTVKELVKPTQSLFQRVCLIWRDLPMPVIAVTHGYCLGAGLQLALGCDVRITTPECQFAIMEAKWGLVPDMGLTQSAYHLVSADVLKALTMSAEFIDAESALQAGLITHIHDKPLEHAHMLAQTFSSRSPDAILAAKRVINRMTKQSHLTLYQEKMWQLKLMVGHNRTLAVKKAKDTSIEFLKRQFN